MLRVTAAMHPARVGRAMSAALWLKVRGRLSREARRLNGLKASERNRALADMPRFAEQMIDVGGSLRPRYWPPVDLAPVTHHHKLAVFDRKRLYVGGLDLNNRRYDVWRIYAGKVRRHGAKRLRPQGLHRLARPT